MNRHRHAGAVEWACLQEDKTLLYANTCGQVYTHPVHYQDDQHPYYGEPGVGGPCGWVLQNVTAGREVYCGGSPRHEHHDLGAAEETVVMRLGSSADAPAEDGGSGEGSWAFQPTALFEGVAAERLLAEEPPVHMSPDHNLFRCEHPDCVRDATAARESDWAVNEAPASFEQQTAHQLEFGGLVDRGPWPVRQYPFEDASGQDACWRQVRALTDAGEVFFLEVWWMNNVCRIARVQWGAFVGVAGVDVIEAVRAWPPAG